MRMEYRTDTIDIRLWVVHKRAKIGGVWFTAGESIEGVRRSSDDKMSEYMKADTITSILRTLTIQK